MGAVPAMKVHTSAASLLRSQTDRFRKFNGTAIELHREMVDAGVKDHKELTSGGISRSTLRKLGHPFGRSSAGRARGVSQKIKDRTKFRGSVPLLPINRQTGGLQRSLRVTGPAGSGHAYSVAFTADYAAFVLSPTGTRPMVARGFYAEIRKRNAARLHGQLLRARDAQRRS